MQKFLRTLMLMAVMLLPFASHAQTLPFNEGFAGTSIPTGWSMYTGLASNVFGGTALTSATSGWNFGGNNGLTDNHARVNIYGTSCNKWLVSPSITLTGITSASLSFDLAFTAYSGANPAATSNIADDKFMVIISTDDGATWSEANATKWMITDSVTAGAATYDLTTLPYTSFQTFYIDLTSYVGSTIKIAFYGESTVSGGDNNLHIDNVYVGEPITCFKVTNLAIDATQTTSSNLTLTWTDALNTGATYTIYNMADNSVVAYGITGTTYNVTGLNANTAYTFEVEANCSATDASATETVTGRTACAATMALPYVEVFNGYTGFPTYPYYGPSVMPACWDYYSNGTNTAETSGSSAYYGGVASYNGTSYGSHEANNPYLYLPIQLTGSAVTSSTYLGYATARGDVRYAILPAFATAINGLQIGFDYKMSTAYSATGAAAVLELGYVTNDDVTTFVTMWSANAITTVQHVVDMNLSSLAAAAPAGARLAFKFSGVHNGTGTSSYSNVACGIDNIVVENLPSCARVTNLTVSGITNNSVTLSWVDTINTGATYTVSDATGVIATGINAMTYTATGLSANTDYTFSVITNCSATDVSAATTVNVHTDCDAMTTLPYTQDFEAEATGSSTSAAFAECWTRLNNGTQYFGQPYISSSSSYNHTDGGTKGLYWTNSTTATTYGDYQCIVLPGLGGSYSVSDCRVKFWAKASSTSYHPKFYVGVMTDAHDINTFVVVDSVNVEGTTWTGYTVNLTGYNGNGTFVAIAAVRPASSWYAYVDDITLEELPSCFEVSDLSASMTHTSVTLTWSDVINTGATYTVYNDNAVVATGVTGTTYTVTGLTANTPYTFGVVANCSATDASQPVNISVTTPCAPVALPFSETFDASLSSNPCWRGANNATAAQVFSGTALNTTSLSSWTYASSARDGLEAGHYYKNVYGTNQKAWMITPAIDLTNVSSAQLSFDVALTDYNNAALPDVNGDTNNSQAFMVIVSTDGGNTWSANNATIWQNEGGDYTYASLASTTYQNKVIDLTQYVGNTIKIAFYTQSIWTGGDNDLHIDNIAVTQASSCPAPVVTVDNFTNRTVSFSWTSTADSVIVGLFNNDGQQVTAWFAPATDSVTNFNLPEAYFPFGYGYVVAQSICGAYADGNLSATAYDVFAVTCNEEEQCPVTFLLTDGYGDGWNGGALDIYDTVSGLIVGSMACPDYGVQDSSVTYTTTYSFCPGRVYSIVYRSGQYDDEVSFTILGPDSTVYGSFSNPTAGVLGYFTHTCPATGCVAETFPFSEDFEDGVLSECWTIDGPGNWTVGTGDYSSSTGAHTGSYNVKINHSSTGNVTKLITPVIDMTGVANAELRFWHVQRSWSGDQDVLTVYYRTSATGEWQSLATYSNEVSTWTEENITLTNLSSTYQIAFEMTDGYGYGVAIDDITIDLPPACSAVSGLTASAITNNSVTLEWTDDFNTGATYTVYEVNPTGETLLASNISGTTYTATNLTGHTSYTFGVVANCTADASSTMATLAVTTMPDPLMCGNNEALTFANADSVSGSTSYFPGYSLYNYSYTEVIIPVTRLLGLGEIKGMEYYVNTINSGSNYFNNCEIYLMNTTATSLSDGFIQDSNNFQLVYSGDLNQTETGWKLVTFDNSFMYDGASNLLVAVRRNHGSWASSGNFGAYTADAQLARYVYRDASAYEIGTISDGYTSTSVPVYHMIGCAGNAPDCMPISNLTVSNVNAYDVTLSWVDNNNTGATYTIYNMADNSVVATGITSTNYVVTGLTPETAYTFGVEANCSATAASLVISVSTTTPPSCFAPTNIVATDLTSTSATLAWSGDANSYLVVVTDGNNTVYNNVVNDTTVALTGLTFETSYSVSINAICGADDTSSVSTASFFTGYCLPNPTSVDNSGITSVSFGGMTNTTHNAVSGSPMYENFSNMVGSVPAGTTATVDITFATGYTYGTIIWVDWNNSMTFEGNEVVYVGTSENSNPTTLTATFDIPATQANGNYRMRILAADSYFDSYTGSIEAAANANPCASYSWGVAEDYTLFVGDAPSCLAVTDLTVSNATANTVTLTWTDALNTGATYSVYEVNATGETLVASNISGTTYTVTGLTATTGYTFGVVANCSATDASIMATVSATTDCANGSCNIYVYAQDSYGDGWNGNAINFIQGGSVMSTYTMPSQGLSSTVIYDTAAISVCAGTAIELSWVSGNFADEVSFDIANSDDEIVFSGLGSDMTAGATFFTLDSCNADVVATDIAIVTIAVNDATMGTTTPAPGTYQIADSDILTLSATANSGYHFLQWNVSYTYEGNPMSQTFIDNPVYLTSLANFSPLVFVAVFEEDMDCDGTICDLVINGSDSYGDGWNNGILSVKQNNVLIGTFTVDSTVATTTISVCSDYPVDFVWNSGSFDSEVFFSVSTITGTQLFNVNGAGSLISGHTFVSVSNPCTSPVVTYVHDSLTLTTAINDATMGTITPAPGTYQYDASDTLFLTATANYGYHFVEWNVEYYNNGVLTTTTLTNSSPIFLCSGLIDLQPLTFTAVFAADTLAIDCTGNTCYVTVTGEDSYNDGWNGAELLMYQNDTLIGVFTLDDGSSDSQNFIVCSDYPLNFAWSSGSYDNEVSFTVSNSFGEIFSMDDVTILDDTVFAEVTDVCSANASVSYFFDIDTLTIIVGVNDATMGTTNPVPGTYQITSFEAMTVTAIPNNGYYFLGWAYSYNNGGTVTSDTLFDATYDVINIDGGYWIGVTPVTFTALFSSQPYVGDSMLVNIAVNDPTMGTTNPAPGAHYFYEGETCSVVAMPYNGYMIEGWDVVVLEAGDTIIDEYVPYPAEDVFDLFEDPVVVQQGYGDFEFFVTAYFTNDTSATQTDYLTLITSVNNPNMGTITPAPGIHHYFLGDSIHFSATPNEGYHVESADVTLIYMGMTLIDSTLDGDITSFDLEVEQMFLGATISVTVNFAVNGESDVAVLNVNVNDANMGHVLINGQQATSYTGVVGETVTLEAVAHEGYSFQNWSDGNSNATRDYLLSDEVATITAIFAQNEGIDVAGMINDLKVYPNPTYGVVNIDADDVVKVEVMDLNGRIVATFDNTSRVDLSSLSAGTYMLRVQTVSGNAVKRVVKK